MSEDTKKINVVIFQEDGTRRTATIETSLESYYKIIGCDTIDIVGRVINGNFYRIVCDDNGLIFHRDPVGVWFDRDGNAIEALYGTIIVTKDAGEELGSVPGVEADELMAMPAVEVSCGGVPFKVFTYEG